MSTREIITLQLGHYSNFIGTHWWNIQESGFVYDQKAPSEIIPDVLFREGETRKGDTTFTPRLILVDLKGSLNTLPQHGGTLYEPPASVKPGSVPWSSEVVVHQEESAVKNSFLEELYLQGDQPDDEDKDVCQDDVPSMKQEATKCPTFSALEHDLDKEVKVWSDYLRLYLHPRSIYVLNDYAHEDTNSPFNVFGYGQSVWTATAGEDLEDKVRRYGEECDFLQGFHILGDSFDGFGGLTSGLLNHLNDEYHSKPCVVFSCSPAEFPNKSVKQDSYRVLNAALSLSSFTSQSPLVVPLSLSSHGCRTPGPARDFTYLSYNSGLYYHTSSILATFLDTVTLPYRTRDHHANLSDITDALSSRGQKIAVGTLGFPLPVWEDQTLTENLLKFSSSSWQCLTPSCNVYDGQLWLQSVTVRGINKNLPKIDPSLKTVSQVPFAVTSDLLNQYMTETFPHSLTRTTVVQEPLSVATPYPQIFKTCVGKTGRLNKTRTQPVKVEKVPTVASLQCCSSPVNLLETLLTEVQRLNIRKFHDFRDAGLEIDEYTEHIESLRELRQCYRCNL